LKIQIRKCDCVLGMAELKPESINTIFADPPYNTGNSHDKTVTYDQNADFAAKNWSAFHSDWDTIDDYRAWSTAWLTQAQRVLKPDGSIWICGSFHNIPDVALTLTALGFYTIQWVAWCIPNAFPHLAGLKMGSSNQTIIWARKSKAVTQFYDLEAARRYNDGKNLRDYWLVNNDSQAGRFWKHPSKKPFDLVFRALDISTPKHQNAVVLDPFAGSGTTGSVAKHLGFDCVLFERKAEYIPMIKDRVTTEKRLAPYLKKSINIGA
jgi:modification methylase